MRSFIFVLYICAFAGPATAQTADALYADRTTLANAKKAAELWAAALAANPKDFEAAWKLSRADYWLGGHTVESEQRHFYEDGIDAGEKAVTLQPTRPDGHFWVAANMGMMAESFGLRAGLRYRGAIKDELDKVMNLDPTFREGSADRALGRWYFKVPRLLGGSASKAEEHLKAALKYNPDSTVTHYFLAELYLDQGRKSDGRAELQKVLNAPITSEWGPEDRDWKDRARALLATVR